MQTKRQSQIVDLAALAIGQSTTKRISLDTNYPNCIGVITNVISNGGDANFRIGLKKSSSVVEDLNNNQNWLASTAVSHEGRVKPIQFNLEGNDISIDLEAVSSAIANLKVEFTFITTK